LIHWPASIPGPTIRPPLIDTWKAMEEIVDSGLARSIGVSNFSIPKLKDILEQARIKPAVNQV
jgi:diketogulonate reductase-like aldo/keto reductase